VTKQQMAAPSLQAAAVPPELLEALARALMAVLAPPPPPAPSYAEEAADFLTAGQLAKRLGVSRETVRRLAVADVLPHMVVCEGRKQTTRRFPRRFADDFARSGLAVKDVAGFAARWRANLEGGGQ
jgi:excisionase family DNA binding protein